MTNCPNVRVGSHSGCVELYYFSIVNTPADISNLRLSSCAKQRQNFGKFEPEARHCLVEPSLAHCERPMVSTKIAS